ncbi:3-hydroxybutyrate dehydrogenase [Granulicoccus sp. GXG6511]|uniref:3-hydroxybutyrate dehydrogenase n=1 Tax=Granulicoccus sp. GXG6511 TaxID=3381351 RepID=UPI003D7DC073
MTSENTSEHQTLAGRRAIVTGGGSGIGEGIARSLAAHGADVTVADLNTENAERVAGEIAGRTWIVDLGRTTELDDLTLETDILVNCAGIQVVSPVEEFDPDRFRLIHRIMLEAPFLLIRAALPHMYAQGWGRIVNISSVHGLVASPFKSAYVSAKHGLEGLSKVVALEGATKGVTSVCINPGYAWTPLVEQQLADQAKVHNMPLDEVKEKVILARQPIKDFVAAKDLGEMVAFVCGPHSAMISGTNFIADGAWTAN